MSIVYCLPSIDPFWREDCLATMDRHLRERCLVIDNSLPGYRRSVAASWNLGIKRVMNEHADWLVLLSEAVRFGHPGGLDFDQWLNDDVSDPWVDTQLVGWHLVAFRRSTLERTGYFDENFFPACLEDSDYLLRLDLAGYPSPRENDLPHVWVTVDATDAGTAHSVKAGLVKTRYYALTPYWVSKWGAEPSKRAYEHPFDDPANDWTFWPLVAT